MHRQALAWRLVREPADLAGNDRPQRRGQVMANAGKYDEPRPGDRVRRRTGGTDAEDWIPVAVQHEHGLMQFP